MKTLQSYFLPLAVSESLSKDVWGAATVGPRDFQNGLEDTTLKQWHYWDGQIIHGSDGKYHMFASRWDQSAGHEGWIHSNAVHAVSEKPIGPYIDQGLCWPEDQSGRGHNVTALVLQDGRYAIVVSETRPGEVFVSSSPYGPWENIGAITVDADIFDSRDAAMSNVSIMIRPDGDFQIVARSGAIMISKSGILGPYKLQGPSIYPSIPGIPKHDLEDPVIWFSGGLHHIVTNCWSDRKAYHLTSIDGIGGWINRGLAYDPTSDFIRYSDGTKNHWNKLERPGVLLELGHVAYVTFSAIDVPKEEAKGCDGHGSKVIVVPFDGEAFERDLETPS